MKARLGKVRLVLALGVVFLPALSPEPLAGQWAADSPEAAALRQMEAMRARDFTAMAALMHPDALREIRDFLVPILEHDEGAEFREMLLGTDDVAVLDTLSHAALFAQFLQFVMASDSSIGASLGAAQMTPIGHLMEGDTVHVVSRLTVTLEGVAMTQMDVLSLRHYQGQWRSLLSGDLSGLVAMIRQALLGPPPDPR